MKKLFTLLTMLIVGIGSSWGQVDGRVVATMSDLVTEAGFSNAKTVKENSIYSFSYNTYIGAIDNSAVKSAYEGSGYVTVAMWIWGNSASGCLFGYGDQATGVKYYISGATVKTTTKNVKDFDNKDLNSGSTRIAANQWNLIAFAIPAKSGTWGNTARYYATVTDNQFFTINSGSSMNEPASGSKKCAIGSGNQGNAREAFTGLIANVTVIESDALLNNSRIAALVGAAPSSSVWYKPAFGGRTWTWNTSTNKYDASDGTTSTGTPARADNKGPVYRFNSGGAINATSGSTIDTSDSGGAWVIGTRDNPSEVTVGIGRWAGSIDVETYQIANITYSVDLKSTEPDGFATVWTDGTLNFPDRQSCSINDGNNQRWYIGENGIITTNFNSVNKGNRQWNFQIVVANDPQEGDTDKRATLKRTRQVMTWGADIYSNINGVKVFHKADDGTLTEKNTTNDENFEVTHDANGMYVTYTCKGYRTYTLAENSTENLSEILLDGPFTSFVVPSTSTLNVDVDQFDLTMITGEGNIIVSEKWTSNILTSPLNITYIGGAGTTDSRVSINHTGNQVTLTGADKTYYLSGSNSATQTTVNFDGTTVNYSDELGIGKAIYNINNTKITTPKFITSQGGNSRSAVVNLTGNTVITVTGNSNVDTNQSSIMIGHWNGSSDVTLSGTAQIVAADAQLLVGKTANTQTITLNGSSNITAMGIKVSSGASGTNTLTLGGGSLTLGYVGITSYSNSRSIAVNVNENTTITANDYILPISQPITVASGKTLTIDGGESNAIVRLTGAVNNNGTIKLINAAVEGGTVRDCLGLSLPYTYENCILVIDETTAEFNAADENITITNIPNGFTTVKLRRVDRRYVTLEVTDGSATFTDSEAKVSGPKCLYDFTFSKETLAERKIENTSVILNSGSRGSSNGLNYDSNFNSGNSYNEETGLLKAKSTPWRHMTGDNAWPDNYSVAVYANVPDIENGCLMAFGSVNGTGNYLALLRGASSNEIKLVKGNGINKAFEVIATMSAENAAVAKHLVVFTKNGSIFKVYCDGVNVATTTYDQTLGAGFQIGSVHGGVTGTGIIRINDNSVSSEVKDAVEIQSIRIFDGVLTDDQMSALMKEFPYVSKGGSYSRTISAAANLGEDDAWTTGETTAHIPTPVVEDASTYYPDVTITTSADATLTVNENATFGKTTFGGSGTLTIAANDGNSLNIGGAVIINSDVVVKFGAMDMSTSPVTKGADANLTFDFSDFNFNKVYITNKYQLTGLIEQDDTHITATGLPSDDDNREYDFEFDDNHYWLTVTVRAPQTVYAPSGTTEIEDDMPVKLTADAENTNGLLIKGDILVISETGPITFIQSPGFCSLNIPEGVTVTVNNNGAQIANVTGSGTLNVPAATSIGVATINATMLTGNGNIALSTFPTAATHPTLTDWTGSIEFPSPTSGQADLAAIFNAWGNTNSTIKLHSVAGWLPGLAEGEEFTVYPTLDILEDQTLTINNGSSDTQPVLKKITGAGNLEQTWNADAGTYALHIGTLTGFTGTLKGTKKPIVVEKLVWPDSNPLYANTRLIKTSDNVTLEKLYIGLQETTAYTWEKITVEEIEGIYVTSVDPVQLARESAVNTVAPYYNFIGTGVGKYTISLGYDKYNSIEDFLAALEAWSTVYDYKVPIVTLNQPTSAFYRIKSGDKYLQDARKSDSDTQRTLTDAAGANESAETIFYLDNNKFIGYKTGYGFGFSVCQTQDTEHLNTQLFTESAEMGKYTIQSQQGTCSEPAYNEGFWGVDESDLSRKADAASGACWKLEPATSVPVTLKASALGYATFCCPVPVKIPSGVEAYVSRIKDNTISLFKIENFKDAEDDVVIPANTAVMLHNNGDVSEDLTVSFEISNYSGEGVTDNGFYGTIAAESMVENDSYYSLRVWKVDDQATKVGFAAKAAGGTLAGFKGWIWQTGTTARNFTIVVDGESDPTGIVEALGLQEDNVDIYDLNGRKLSSYKKGINIVNGKKVMVQ